MYKNPGILRSFWVILGSLASEMSLSGGGGGGGGPLDFIVIPAFKHWAFDLKLDNFTPVYVCSPDICPPLSEAESGI